VDGEFDNRDVLKEIASLRHNRATLLGYESHAEFVLEERMAESPTKVYDFLKRLLTVSRPAAEKDVQQLQVLKQELNDGDTIAPWDVSFYAEKLKIKLFDFDENMLRPYFSLDKVVEGVFAHAKLLYGLTFIERSDLPVYHEDVKVYEVRNHDDEFIALFYADFFPRESKRNGAWATTFKEQGLSGGKLKRPHAAIVCNLTRPTATKPSLLNMAEVETLFHEFGHALHMMLSRCTYRSLAGANVYWDFVELPSQIMENWTKEQESLNLFAHHYESGETIPAPLVEKIKASTKFQAGYFSLRQLNFGFLDMAWHSFDPKDIADIEKFEIEHTNKTNLFKHEEGSLFSAGFGHIFAGGYSAGYYSYKWAEVLDADAFELFKEHGIFNREIADAFRQEILEKGGSEHPMELYKRFRGREPDPEALLRRDGLLE
jgi:peptidyl-dipeptidase Dcp